MSNKLKKALTVCAILLFGAVTLSTHNPNDGNIICETYKVRAGDTFWDISQRYRDLDERNLYILEYQDELKKLNPWLADAHCQLKPDNELTIQYMRKERKNDGHERSSDTRP